MPEGDIIMVEVQPHVFPPVQIDTFIKTTITNRCPIPVSSAREENVVDYPDWATRELVMNTFGLMSDFDRQLKLLLDGSKERAEGLEHFSLWKYGMYVENNAAT